MCTVKSGGRPEDWGGVKLTEDQLNKTSFKVQMRDEEEMIKRMTEGMES